MLFCFWGLCLFFALCRGVRVFVFDCCVCVFLVVCCDFVVLICLWVFCCFFLCWASVVDSVFVCVFLLVVRFLVFHIVCLIFFSSGILFLLLLLFCFDVVG